MPDKAIDLIDEAASRLKMEIESLPQPIDTLQGTINAKKIELQALKRETDKATIERAATMEEDIANMEEECHQLYGQWQSEKSAIDAISLAKEQIEEANHELEVATRHGDFSRSIGNQIWKTSTTPQGTRKTTAGFIRYATRWWNAS